MTSQPNDSAEVAKTRQERTNERLAGATGILALGNIFSRILGLAREVVLTDLFGATGAVDAFQVSIIAPKAIYDLLIGGHVNGAIVPVLSDIVSQQGRDELWRVLSILLSVVTTALLGLVLLIQLFTPQITQLVASGSDANTLALATDLLRITSPALIFLGLFALFSGTLIALRKFTLPAFAGVVFNGCIVIITLLLAPPVQIMLPKFGEVGTLPSFIIARPAESVTIVALGWFIGALAQMLLQLIGLRKARLRFTLNWRHPVLRSILLLYTPVMFSLIMDTLIIRPFSYNLASQTGEGNIAVMNWATTLIQFPQGLVATAISIAILPTLARQAVTKDDDTEREYKDTLGLGLRLTITLIIPAMVGLFVLAIPIIQLLFQHGAFDAEATQITSQALRLYLIGLPFAAIDLLLVYAFYARKDTLTPALVGLVSLIVYMVTALALLDRYGLFSLMIADSVKHFVHASISGVLLWLRMKGFGNQQIVQTLVKTIIAAGAMGVVGWLILPSLTQWIGTTGFIRETLLVLTAGGICSLVFLGLAYVLKIQELRWIGGLLRRRILG